MCLAYRTFPDDETVVGDPVDRFETNIGTNLILGEVATAERYRLRGKRKKTNMEQADRKKINHCGKHNFGSCCLLHAFLPTIYGLCDGLDLLQPPNVNPWIIR